MIERKAAGEEVIVQEAPDAEPAEVPDLMAALQASLDAVRGTSAPAKTPKAPAQKSTGRQKSAAKG